MLNTKFSMKKIALIILLCGVNFYAQNNFQQGLITTSNGEQISALIGLYSWKKFPNKIDYKLNENSSVQQIESANISSLETNSGLLYLKKTLPVDISSNITDQLNDSYDPKFEERTIFLKSLVQGKASLYSSLATDHVLYFYKTDDQNIEQLIYKRYTNADQTIIATNSSFLKQLSQDVSCNPMSYSSPKYDESSLKKYFVSYNKCVGSEYQVNIKSEKLELNFKVLGGADYTSLTVQNYDRWRNNDLEFDAEISPRIGFELELQIPGNNKNNFSAFLQTFYKNYSASKEHRTSDFDVSYSGLEIIPGLRYNLNLKNDQSIFFDVGLNINITLSESFSSSSFGEQDSSTLFESNKLSSSFGIGYNKNKFTASLKYYLPTSSEGAYYRNESLDVQTFESKMQSFGLLLGYRLF